MQKENILIWLPSPMGDAILCSPALKAIRKRFQYARITFFSSELIREILSPTDLTDSWLIQKTGWAFTNAKTFREHKFTHIILLKNSFGSALTAFLALIPCRVGYSRQGRALLLTDKLYPAKLSNGKFKPTSMVDYYLALAFWLGAETANLPELNVEPECQKQLQNKLPQLANRNGPLVILVPGGAFGPSKYWPAVKFAETADRLISKYNATIVISVAPTENEKQIAEEICNLSHHSLINLAENPLTIGQLKSLFSTAELVITNDTGPRHIAVALKRKVITLFGPNDPVWTDTGWGNEIQIVADVPCAPCGKGTCSKSQHLCMESITVEMVCQAAEKLFKEKQISLTSKQNFYSEDKKQGPKNG